MALLSRHSWRGNTQTCKLTPHRMAWDTSHRNPHPMAVACCTRDMDIDGIVRFNMRFLHSPTLLQTSRRIQRHSYDWFQLARLTEILYLYEQLASSHVGSMGPTAITHEVISEISIKMRSRSLAGCRDHPAYTERRRCRRCSSFLRSNERSYSHHVVNFHIWCRASP